MTSVFDKLQLSSYDVLDEIEKSGKRIECPNCKRTYKYYCYNCRKPLLKTPTLNLPITLDVILHPTEKVAKSTALAATILAPENTNWIVYPDVPDYDENETLLLFPSPDAKPLSEIENLQQYKRIVCIESVWKKAKVVASNKNITKLKKVVIQSHETVFWRYQSLGKSNLATIEAIYYFYREWYDAMKYPYSGQVDDLLYFYCYQYKKIQKHYKDHPEMRFVHIDNYIQYEKKEEEETKESEKKMDEEK